VGIYFSKGAVLTRRVERLNTLIRQELSELLRYQVKDPRLGNALTVTEVATSPDMRHARVFVSCLGSDEDRQDTMRSLVTASGFLRKEMAQRLRLRRVPELSFQWDDCIERGSHLLELIDRLSKEDAEGRSGE